MGGGEGSTSPAPPGVCPVPGLAAAPRWWNGCILEKAVLGAGELVDLAVLQRCLQIWVVLWDLALVPLAL